MSKKFQTRKRTNRGAKAGPSVRDQMVPHDTIVLRSPELKHLDTNTGGYVGGVTSAGTLTSISDVGQGYDGTNRVGDALKVRGVQFRASAYHQAGSVQGILRFIVFSWNEDTAPTAATVLQNVGSALSVVSPYNEAHIQNSSLNILLDRCYAGDSSPDAFYLEMHRVVTLQVTYAAAATTGAGKLYVLMISDAGLATNCAYYQWFARILFDDV